MQKFSIIIFLCIFPAICHSQNSMNDLISKSEKRMDKILDRYDKKKQEIFSEYDKRQARIMAEYNEFCNRIMKKWGDTSMIESTRKKWVEYSHNEDSRTIVDFEEGTVKVEVLRSPSEDDGETPKRIEEALGDLMASKGKSPGFESEVIPQEDLSDTPVLEDQIDLSDYPEAIDDPADLVKEIVGKEEKEKRTVQTEDGHKEVIAISLKLVPDHILRRAEKFKDIIHRHAVRFSVNEPLIYAIIEQESFFNPAARSHVPAYGLMQIVPKSGGLDANRYVHNRDVIPSASYLYDPDNNIELGTGYLKKQMEVYFKGVTDPSCRMLCAIAAYNTGQGNVYYALTGKRTKSNAIIKINSMKYDQLYTHLKRNLPHNETRDYIEKVTTKIKKYIE